MTNLKSRRFFRPRFTLATLLVLITVVAIPLSYVAQRRAWNERRKEIIDRSHSRFIFFNPESTPYRQLRPKTSYSGWWNAITKDDLTPLITTIAVHHPEEMSFLPNTPVSDEELLSLAAFPELVELRLYHARQITDRGMSVVNKLPDLKEVSIEDAPKLTGEFLVDWRNAEKLRSLKFDQVDALQAQHLAVLEKFANLREFRLSQCASLDDSSMQASHPPPSLKSLTLRALPLGNATLSRWLNSLKLEVLRIDLPIDRAIAPALARQTTLQSLEICNAPLVDDDFRFLGQCEKLYSLKLSGMPTQGAFLHQIMYPEQMRMISLDSTLLNDQNAASLHRFTNLQMLYLNWTPISCETFADQEKWPPMTWLWFIGCEASDKGKNSLAQIKGPFEIRLPVNFLTSDMERFQNKPPSYNAVLCWQGKPDVPSVVSAEDQKLGVSSYYSPKIFLDRIDRCPQELMAPVIRLHELAKAKTKE